MFGFSHYVYIILSALLPLLVFILTRLRFVQLALLLILLSKWRIFAVRPRYWLTSIQSNAVDIIAGFSFVLFMAQTTSASWQLGWVASYAIWLAFIKPNSSTLYVSIQAMLGQVLGLVAVFLRFGNAPVYILVIAAWAICYLAARHFFTNFDDDHSSLYAHAWGYFAAALVWVLSHWLLFYGFIAQPALLLGVVGIGLGTLYYLDETDRLSSLLRRQFVFIMVAIIVVILVFSDWVDKAV